MLPNNAVNHRRTIRHRRTAAVALGLAAIGATSLAVLEPDRSGAATPPSALFTANGVRLESGATVPAAGLLPLTVRPDSNTTSSTKFTVDGVYLGTDISAPFQVPLAALAPGEHKVRYTTKADHTSIDEQTIRFTVGGGATSSSPAQPPGTVSARPPSSTTPPPSPTGSSTKSGPSTLPSSSPNSNSGGSGGSGGSATVHNATELQRALSTAGPGAVITLADGSYNGKDVKNPSGKEPGRFVISTSGTAAAPITLRGSAAAQLDGGGTGGGYVIHLSGAHYWQLQGFTVRSASKGIVLDASSHIVIDSVHVTNIGQEGVHFRTNSTDNVIRNSTVDYTGMTSPNYGEGVYIGSAQSNWSTYTGGQPDRSDRNQVLSNRIVDTAAENIDIKEGSTGGTVRGNSLGGNRIASKNSADSWIDVKGNGYLIDGNHGVTAARPGTSTCGDPKGDPSSTKDPFCDGMQVHVILPGWGSGNVFTKNVLEVNAPGVGIWLQNTAVGHNVIRCDNAVTGARAGTYAYNHYTALSCS